jgi:hypothetical protein
MGPGRADAIVVLVSFSSQKIGGTRTTSPAEFAVFE